MADIYKFDEAIEHSAGFKKRHLLLGNGFSIACQPKIFTYRSLYDQADFSSAPRLSSAFEAIGTTDFEYVIKALESASRVLPVYSSGAHELASQMAKDAEALKEILVGTVARNHPDVPNDISAKQFLACRRFLAHFLGETNKNGRVYTLNYDLLLYWTLMQKEIGFGNLINLTTDDGFGRDEDTEPGYVNWMGESNAHNQRVHYLHGALHLFDAGAELQKYTWVNTGKPLLEQAREAMGQDKYPLFVAEGTSDQKLERIRHSAYLHHSYKSFSAQMEQVNDALFIFGHSLADNDQHILKRIARGRIKQVYVGLYGSPSNNVNGQIMEAARQLADSRQRPELPLNVSFFDAESANVWNS